LSFGLWSFLLENTAVRRVGHFCNLGIKRLEEWETKEGQVISLGIWRKEDLGKSGSPLGYLYYARNEKVEEFEQRRRQRRRERGKIWSRAE
jgi:hypothetical protein